MICSADTRSEGAGGNLLIRRLVASWNSCSVGSCIASSTQFNIDWNPFCESHRAMRTPSKGGQVRRPGQVVPEQSEPRVPDARYSAEELRFRDEAVGHLYP